MISCDALIITHGKATSTSFPLKHEPNTLEELIQLKPIRAIEKHKELLTSEQYYSLLMQKEYIDYKTLTSEQAKIVIKKSAHLARDQMEHAVQILAAQCKDSSSWDLVMIETGALGNKELIKYCIDKGATNILSMVL
jgi:hypothetical protein